MVGPWGITCSLLKYKLATGVAGPGRVTGGNMVAGRVTGGNIVWPGVITCSLKKLGGLIELAGVVITGSS